MPKLAATVQTSAPPIQFAASPALDMMNAMYFTSLVTQIEGIDGWPVRLRDEMAPDLLAELDFLYNYPAGDPGILGTLGDNLFVHPEAWATIEDLIAYVANLRDGDDPADRGAGIQGLIFQAIFRYPDDLDPSVYAGTADREAIERRLRSLGDRDTDTIMRDYDRPDKLRERIIALIQRFHAEHYQNEMADRMPALSRSVAAHGGEAASEAEALARKLTGKPKSCLEAGCAGAYHQHVFAPSIDMGVYNSCAIVDGVHGMFYPLEPQYRGFPVDMEETRMARIYKALGDEQRLRILRLLRNREMYAQEIVESTGIHQSVVSRHLTFMKAVGLVNARRQNNMKFFSLNPEVREQLASTLSLFASQA